jgi:hypothetical protein
MRYKKDSKWFTLIERANRNDLVLDLRKEYATPLLSQIEPILDVSEQVIGLIAGRKFDNGKGLAGRGLIIKRKKYGVSDGFRTRDLRIHNPAL